MYQFPRYVTVFSFLAIGLVSMTGGCSEINEAIDCEEMCEQMQTCIDGDIDVQRCSSRCEDKVDEGSLRRQLDDCTDCLENNYACAEVPEECRTCEAVTDALL